MNGTKAYRKKTAFTKCDLGFSACINYKSNEYTKYIFFSFVLYKLVLDLEIAKGEVTDKRVYYLPLKEVYTKIPLELFQF